MVEDELETEKRVEEEEGYRRGAKACLKTNGNRSGQRKAIVEKQISNKTKKL
jgi:hypothetical protein